MLQIISKKEKKKRALELKVVYVRSTLLVRSTFRLGTKCTIDIIIEGKQGSRKARKLLAIQALQVEEKEKVVVVVVVVVGAKFLGIPWFISHTTQPLILITERIYFVRGYGGQRHLGIEKRDMRPMPHQSFVLI